MKTFATAHQYPDLYSYPSAFRMSQRWDTFAVAQLIRERSENGKVPAFLYVGQIEAELLREHLAESFGEDAVSTLHDSYYMGLKIVTVKEEQFISTGGRKVSRTLQPYSYQVAS